MRRLLFVAIGLSLTLFVQAQGLPRVAPGEAGLD